MSAILMGTVGGVERAAIPDSSQHGEHFWGVDLSNQSATHPGENVFLQPLDNFAGVRVRPIRRMLGKPLPRNEVG